MSKTGRQDLCGNIKLVFEIISYWQSTVELTICAILEISTSKFYLWHWRFVEALALLAVTHRWICHRHYKRNGEDEK